MWSDWGDVVCARFSRGMDYLVGTLPRQSEDDASWCAMVGGARGVGDGWRDKERRNRCRWGGD